MLKYFQLQYLKRLQYTAKKMTGLSKVAKEANKGLKFLDTRYTQFTYMQKVISCLCSKFCFSSLSGRSFGDNTLHFMCKRLSKWRNLDSVKRTFISHLNTFGRNKEDQEKNKIYDIVSN